MQLIEVGTTDELDRIATNMRRLVSERNLQFSVCSDFARIFTEAVTMQRQDSWRHQGLTLRASTMTAWLFFLEASR